MPIQSYTRVTERFRAYGVDLNNPPDSVRPDYYPFLENLRSYTDGILQPRQGLASGTNVIVNKTPVHSVRRLNDPAGASWARVIGTGDALAYGQGPYTQATYNAANVAYDGNPLILIPYRPDQATAPFMYVAAQVGNDVGNFFLRQMKINRSGTVHQWGLPAPLNPPTVELGAFKTSVDGAATTALGLNFQANAGWAVDATVITALAGAPVARIPALAVTTAARYDTGTSGWVSLVLPATSMSVVGVGTQLDFVTPGPTASTLLVHDVFPGTVAGATITVSSVVYDAHPTLTGLCTIQASSSAKEIIRDAIVLINGGTNYYRILSTRLAADGTTSFRVNSGATTVAATNSIVVVPSIRVYDSASAVFTAAGGDAVAQLAIEATSGIVAGTGFIHHTVTGDLTVLKSTGRAISDDDPIHLSLKFTQAVGANALGRITGGRILFNCDAAGGAPPYTANYFYRAITPNDLVPAAQGIPSQSAIDNRANIVGRGLIDTFNRSIGDFDRSTLPIVNDDRTIQNRDPFGYDPYEQPNVFGISPMVGGDPEAPSTSDPSRSQTGTGDAQWHELIFRRGELVRVGTDVSRGFANITGFCLELTLTAGAAITVDMDSLSLWGTYPLDSSDLASPYTYRFRYRASATGARSNYSPSAFGPASPFREQIIVTPAADIMIRPVEVDYIDFERFGGTLTNWTYVGSIPVATASFTDIAGDGFAAVNVTISEGDTNYQPWPVRLAPKNGTFAIVAGTAARSITNDLNYEWIKGTGIKVQRPDGSFFETTIRRVFGSGAGASTLVEFADSIGAATTNVLFTIAEPLLRGVPLPSAWTSEDRGFACGDSNNPGALYFTNGNNLDSTQDTFYLEITNPSEPLVNGCAFNGKNYVWSTERMFEIENIGPNNFIAVEIPGRKGLISRYGLAVGERIWYVSRDGIYQTSGGDSISITDETLKPLFTTEGGVGTAVNGFQPPNLVLPNNIRLSYYKGYLYFLYKDLLGALRCLTYTPRSEKPGWWPDVYPNLGVTYLYGEEGLGNDNLKLLACASNTTTAKIYQVSGASDDSSGISCRLRTQYFDAQDRRAEKRWGDFIVDVDPNNTTLNLVVWENAGLTNQLALTPTSVTGNGRNQTIIDIASGADPETDYARSVALDVSWTGSNTPQLFQWEPSYALRPERSDLRATLWTDDGYQGDKFFQGIEVDANTFNVPRTVRVEYNGLSTNVAETITMQHNGQIQKAYPFHPAFIAHTVRLRPTDGADTWVPYNYRWLWQPEPPLVDRYESQQTSFGMDQFMHFKAAYVTLRSTSVVTLTITRTEDGTSWAYSIPSTVGSRIKQYVPFQVTKGKAFIFLLAAEAPFRFYKDDTYVLGKGWASEQAYSNYNVFGAPHGDGKVEI